MNIRGMKVMSVDDNNNNLLMIEVFAKNLGLEVESFDDPLMAMKVIGSRHYDIYIVDYMMPGLNGIDLIKAIREVEPSVPIIMITAVGDDINLHQEALREGASDFMAKPVNGTVFKLRVELLLKLYMSQKLLEDRAALLQDEVDKATQEVIKSELETLTVVGRTAEYKDPETGAHIYRVSHYARLLAKVYGLTPVMQEVVFYASPLHDIGKVGIPDSVLLKPGSLDENEWEIMKSHTLIGYNILKKSKSKYLKAGSVIAFNHHEKYDGSGYPKGLKGEDIPLFGRIVAICDVFDALTSRRPYKEPWSFDKAMEYICEQGGKHFDPDLVDLFVKEIDQVKDIYMSVDEEV